MTPGSAGRILLAEDSPSQRRLFRGWLVSAGFEVVERENGCLGDCGACLSNCTAVVTDLFMPETDGFELIARLRKHFPDILTVAMSSRGSQQGLPYLGMAQSLGASTVLEKPFGRDDLLRALGVETAGTDSPGDDRRRPQTTPG